jgi:hypothetical protein
MVKNIVIVVLIVISLFTTVYAIYQQTEAKRQESLAFENAERAQVIMQEAERAQEEAVRHSAAAAAAMAEIERQLKLAKEKCK